MKIISHRGNLNGSDRGSENNPEYIDCAIQAGYDVEIDLRFINNKFYLGHDDPISLVDGGWLMERKSYLWVHCKTLEAASEIKKQQLDIKSFCHMSDPYVWITDGHIWVHDLTLTLNNQCIIPLMTEEDIQYYNKEIVYAVCTDVVKFAESILESNGY